MVTLSDEQVKARNAIKNWYFNEPTQKTFYLAGYAGSGKTTIAKPIVADLKLDPDAENDVLYGSYTGKAAVVLKKKGMRQSTTIHRMIYKPIEEDSGKVSFMLNYESVLKATKLVVLDECSMIDDNMAKDLLTFGKKILVIGDPGQLPPVKGEGAFTNRDPDFFLTEIHRQAAENPIIRLATMARMGQKIPYSDYGDGIQHVNFKNMDYDNFIKSDQILTGKNETRMKLNVDIRSHYGFDKYPLKNGAKLICLKNQHKLGLLNGMLFTTNNASNAKCHWSPGKFFTQSFLDDDGNKYPNLDVYIGHFDNYDKNTQEMKDRLEKSFHP